MWHIARDGIIVNSKSTPKLSPVSNNIISNILINIVDDKVFADALTIKHSIITPDYSTLNSNPCSPLLKSPSSCNFCWKEIYLLITISLLIIIMAIMANVVFLKGKVKFIFVVIMHEPHIY